MSQAALADVNSPPVSLDHTLHRLLSHLAPARVAAMLLLVHHSDVSNGGERQVPAKAMMAALRDLETARKTLKNLEEHDLTALNLSLTADLRKSSDALEQALSETVHIMARCSVGDEGELKGFQSGTEMYDLCCRRVAQGVADFSEALSAFFLEQTDKNKADALEITSTIAMEIGKIGRVINMVATNATIEAARAGDAGKGFTVIADEVKVLSSRVSSLSVSLADRLT